MNPEEAAQCLFGEALKSVNKVSDTSHKVTLLGDRLNSKELLCRKLRLNRSAVSHFSFSGEKPPGITTFDIITVELVNKGTIKSQAQGRNS